MRPLYIFSERYAERCDAALPAHPERSAIGHDLVRAYGLFPRLEVEDPLPASDRELREYHTAEYLAFLKRVERSQTCPEDGDGPTEAEFEMFGLMDDCPAFPTVLDYVRYVAGGTLLACRALADGDHTVAIHWDGGRHHAKPAEAHGFCYVNDVVLGVLCLREAFARVVVVDIDVHHGDGTEEAFYEDSSVLTISVHQHGPGLYPGTGAASDVGSGKGRNRNINIPLSEGTSDTTFQSLLLPVLAASHSFFQPEAAVLVCGCDALAGDRLGTFNLTLESYVAVVSELRGWKIPLLVLGGGGYNVPNTARCWAVVTAVCCQQPESPAESPSPKRRRTDEGPADASDDELPPPSSIAANWRVAEIPDHRRLATYAPTFQLAVARSAVVDSNTEERVTQLQQRTLAMLQVGKGS